MSWLLLLAWLQLAAADYQLPTDLAPRHYDLQYTFDVDTKTNFSYFGVVKIALTVNNPTSTIVLHAKNLTINYDKVELKSSGQTAPSITSQETHYDYNFLKLHLNSQLEKGHEYNLTLPFSGNLQLGLDGVYVSTYVDRKTQVKEYLIATQFEAISARQGFPCFDEPMMKATFTITIGHHKDFSAVSNMPIESSSNNNSLESIWPWSDVEKSVKKPITQFVWDRFERSAKMSTYLVAFVISKFAFIESPEGLSNVKFRIAARKDAVDQTKYASLVGPKVLSYFEEFFDVPYPLPKQDMVAIPDFAAGAMENWGLITYRETALLYDPEESSLTNKERVAEVIAHELAHQWFGNLVTMKWWSDLWLNEGFATFVAVKGIAAVEPQWRAPTLHSLQTLLHVLQLDSLESSHPVSVPLDDPKRISEIFDEISYKKGATIIRMMTMFLGEDVFRKAIKNYLVKYSYTNAEQDDLWRELTAVSNNLPSNVTVKDIMDTWTTQTGFPILNAERDYKKGTVAITQSRFYSLKTSNSSSSWWIPLTTLGKGQTNSSMQWISDKQGVKEPYEIITKMQEDQWFLLNTDMIAPMRVKYDEKNWRLVASALRSPEGINEVPIPARVQLINDAFALAAADMLDYDLTLTIANYLRHETEYLPLETGLDGLAKIEKLLKRQPSYGAFQKYIRRLIGETYNKVGGIATKSIKDGDDLYAVKMQEMTSAWACRAKVPGCEENAMELYQQWMDSSTPDEDNPIPLDLRRTVYCVGISRGGVAQWRWALERRRQANVAAAQQVLLYALACSRDTWLLHTLLEWAVTDGSEVRRQDSAFVIAAVARSQAGYYLAKDFVYQRIDEIYKALAGQGRRIGGVVSALLDQFTTQKELDEFEIWFEKNKELFEASKLVIKQGIEKAKVNIAWMNKHSKYVVEKMREYSD